MKEEGDNHPAHLERLFNGSCIAHNEDLSCQLVVIQCIAYLMWPRSNDNHLISLFQVDKVCLLDVVNDALCCLLCLHTTTVKSAESNPATASHTA
jgi:hypothetical protein